MPTTSFPTPLIETLWNIDGPTRAALIILTGALPFDRRPEWILPYLSEDGIDFDALSWHEFATEEEDALVAIAASLYGYEDGGRPVGVSLCLALPLLSEENFATVVFAMKLGVELPEEFLRDAWPLAQVNDVFVKSNTPARRGRVGKAALRKSSPRVRARRGR